MENSSQINSIERNFTGVEDVDREILLYLDDEDLFKACNLSHYTKNLCNDDFWRRKFSREYGAILRRIEYREAYKQLREIEDIDEMLIWAADNGETDLVTSFLKNGANIHAYDDEALQNAASEGHTDTVRLLLENGADIHAYDDLALRYAASSGHIDTVKVLLENGANIHAIDDWALRFAASNGHKDTVRLLLESGANAEVSLNRGTPKAIISLIRTFNKNNGIHQEKEIPSIEKKGQCEGITKNRERCKNISSAGSKFCWRHQ